jgi:hypothetical protein
VIQGAAVVTVASEPPRPVEAGGAGPRPRAGDGDRASSAIQRGLRRSRSPPGGPAPDRRHRAWHLRVRHGGCPSRALWRAGSGPVRGRDNETHRASSPPARSSASASASRVLGQGAHPMALGVWGAALGIPGFAAIVLSSLIGQIILFLLGTFAIGLGIGLFGHATLTATMRSAPPTGSASRSGRGERSRPRPPASASRWRGSCATVWSPCRALLDRASPHPTIWYSRLRHWSFSLPSPWPFRLHAPAATAGRTTGTARTNGTTRQPPWR